MKSRKLIIVLILLGLGLIVVGATRMNLSGQAGQISPPASVLSSWLTGLTGAALLAVGGFLLRKQYLKARSLLPASALNQRRPVIGFALAMALVLVIMAAILAITQFSHAHP
ncbi:MAG: hypothetical protein M3Y50_13305 [Acidobacteriota bacterium]|nr:hypothetical protein [Acidobacteriota bacterium]